MRKKKKGNNKQERADPIAFWLSGGEAKDILCPKGYTPLIKNEEVIKCAGHIADLVSSMTLMLMENKENGDLRIKNELSKKMDVSPNKYMTRKNFIHKIVNDMILHGNSIAYPIFNEGFLDTIELWDIERIAFEERREGYGIRYAGRSFGAEEVLHFSLYPDSRTPYWGQGFMPAVKETVSNLIQANATKTGFLQSKWKPSMIISIEGDNEELLDQKARERVLNSYTRTTEIGEPWLIPAGEIDVKTIQPLTLNDLAIQDSITLDKRGMAAAFGVPPYLLGVGEFNKEEHNHFIANRIMSIAMTVQQELTKKILHSPNLYFKFNPKTLMQYDLVEKVEFVKAMVANGMMSRNEGRNDFDYSPADKAEMNEFIILENYIPVDRVGDQKKLKGSEE